MLLTAVYLSGGDTVDLEWIMKRFDVSRSVAKDDIAKLRKIVTLTTERTGVNVRVRYRMEPDNG